MRKSISISQKYFIYFLALYLISIIIVASYSYYIAKKSILDRTYNQLTSVRFEKARNIERFFSDRIHEISSISIDKSVLDTFDNNKKLPIINDKIIKNLKLFLSNNKYYKEIIISYKENNLLRIDSSGYKQVYNNNDAYQSDKIKMIEKLNDDSKKDNRIIINDYETDKFGNLFFFMYYPLFYKELNKFEGFMLFNININAINDIMFSNIENNGLGRSGEAYIVGPDFKMRTTSRFNNNSINLTYVKTKASYEASQNISGTNIIMDYRNVEVLSSYAPLKINDLNWIIIAEIDTKEAFKPIYDLRNSIVVLCVITTIFIFGLVYIGSNKLTAPIIRLKDAANKIKNGDYSVRLISNNNDEIGELITSFNSMVEQLNFQAEKIKKDKLSRVKAVFDAQEKERQRLSRDLHDGQGQMLLATKIKLEQIKNQEINKSNQNLLDAIELLKNAISDIRIISNDLMPTVLTNFGLREGLNKLCRDIFDNSEIKFEFFYNNDDKCELDNFKQIYIYRISQELFNNILKHSYADLVKISLVISNKIITLRVTDNGIGFDSNIKYPGNGLNNIFDRVDLLLGDCRIESFKDKGTNITIHIPV